MKYNLYVEDVSVEAVFNRLGGVTGAKRVLSGERLVVEQNEAVKRGQILAFNQNVAVAGGEFVLDQCFTKANPKVKFWYIDERLPKLFGKTSGQTPIGQLATHTLLEPKHNPDILGAIMPHAKRFIHISQFYRLIEAQGQGQEGPLLVSGYANIAYIIDENGAPWAVDADWDGGGWGVSVGSVAHRGGWDAGGRVLSQAA